MIRDTQLPTVPNIDLPAICSPKFKPGPPSDEAQVLSDRLHEVLIRYLPVRRTYPPVTHGDDSSSAIPTSSLVIEPGKAAWVLYVDATCVNYDGNLFDAALIAMVAALKNSAFLTKTYFQSRF
jgi:exosome complex component RRP43